MTPLEKMARALMVYQGQNPDMTISWGGEHVLDERKRELRAALQSLKDLDEGTVEAMVNAMNHTFECSVCGGDVPDCGCGHESWQDGSSFKKARASLTAAINHILKDDK
jgi:hypothetical protein